MKIHQLIRSILEEGYRQDDTFSELKDELAASAQKVYDDWEQNEDGYCEELGTGGICQDIAEAMCGVLIRHGYECSSVSQQVGEQHVYVIAKTEDGVYEVDIPPQIYETGGGYCWKKKQGVKFDDSCIVVNRLSSDPDEFESYTDSW